MDKGGILGYNICVYGRDFGFKKELGWERFLGMRM